MFDDEIEIGCSKTIRHKTSIKIYVSLKGIKKLHDQ